MHDTSELTRTLTDDPWAVPLTQRRFMAREFEAQQKHWLTLLRACVEPPQPEQDFPAYLLASAAFERLRERIGSARCRTELDTATADELQHFVDHYRSYLRSELPNVR